MKAKPSLASARTALKAALGVVPVLLRGDTQPSGEDPLVILDFVSSTPYGYDQSTETSVQVSVYSPKVAQAHDLKELAAAAMQAAGFTEGQTRPAPDDIGVITDWRM